ncbi:MAG: tyrosine-protein phosphatase [Phycisphaeraceae bacterium]|nr:tyrosine-protein phosphatase [Phycisphaeraceae bacterium]
MPSPAPQTAASPPSPPARRPGWVRWVVVAVVIAAAWVFFDAFVRDNVFPKNFAVVEENQIYRSAALTPAATRKVHDQYHIKTIIDLGAYDKDPEGERLAQRTAEALGITRHVFRLEGDGTGNPNYYVLAERLLEDPDNRPVLVHCSAGAQRTTACIALHQYISEGKPWIDELPRARRFGHDPGRNPRLKPYLEQWAEKIKAAVLSGGSVAGADPLPSPPTRP